MTFYSPVERTKHFMSPENFPVYTKSVDEVDDYPWDLTDRLDSGETVSSVATEVSGVTLDSGSLATPVYTMTVSGTNGSIKVAATTSAGRKLEQVFLFADKPSARAKNDYYWSTGATAW